MHVSIVKADDYVCAFRYKQDAEMFYHKMQKRLRKFNLELSMEKTNIILFSKEEQSGSFEFLGFEFRWGKSHKGKDIIKRRTSRKKLKKSIKSFAQWCKKMRNKRLKTIFKKLFFHHLRIIKSIILIFMMFQKIIK